RRTTISRPGRVRQGATSVPAVERAARILVALGNGQDEATLTELAGHLRIHKSTAHGILATLARHRLVSRDGVTRKYRLGPGLAALAGAAVGPDLGALARPYLERLQRLSGETATLHGHAASGRGLLPRGEVA